MLWVRFWQAELLNFIQAHFNVSVQVADKPFHSVTIQNKRQTSSRPVSTKTDVFSKWIYPNRVLERLLMLLPYVLYLLRQMPTNLNLEQMTFPHHSVQHASCNPDPFLNV